MTFQPGRSVSLQMNLTKHLSRNYRAVLSRIQSFPRNDAIYLANFITERWWPARRVGPPSPPRVDTSTELNGFMNFKLSSLRDSQDSLGLVFPRISKFQPVPAYSCFASRKIQTCDDAKFSEDSFCSTRKDFIKYNFKKYELW